jgi:alkanesulfonate monooxygenase SsuD/methylene tetrahydromethanopterin reductase-like flavin-dependent oxidoreductase (luciferase family)
VSSLQVGVMLVQNLPYDRWRSRVLELEQLGYDGVYVWDHLVHRTQPPTAPLFDGLTLLAAAAEFTSRLRLGTLVASPTIRHPVLLAKQAMTIDNASDGRMELGIGAAGVLLDYQVLGMQPWSKASRCSGSARRSRWSTRRCAERRRTTASTGPARA